MSQVNKICSMCGAEKPLTEFYKRGDSDRYRSHCRGCLSVKSAKRRANNIEKYRDMARRYSHSERGRLIISEYRKKNKEIIAEKLRIYYLSNKEKLSQQHKEWFAKWYYSDLDNNRKIKAERQLRYNRAKGVNPRKFSSKENKLRIIRESRNRAKERLSDSYLKMILLRKYGLRANEIPAILIEQERTRRQLQKRIGLKSIF